MFFLDEIRRKGFYGFLFLYYRIYFGGLLREGGCNNDQKQTKQAKTEGPGYCAFTNAVHLMLPVNGVFKFGRPFTAAVTPAGDDIVAVPDLDHTARVMAVRAVEARCRKLLMSDREAPEFSLYRRKLMREHGGTDSPHDIEVFGNNNLFVQFPFE
jgi:hypothetical protein